LIKPIINHPPALPIVKIPKIKVVEPIKSFVVKTKVKHPPILVNNDRDRRLRLTKAKAKARIRKIKLLAI